MALTLVAGALARAGKHQQATAAATQAETVARSMRDPDRHAVALTRVARALAETGQQEQATAAATQAETLARSVTTPDSQAVALHQVAGALARAGQRGQATAGATRGRGAGPLRHQPGHRGSLALVARIGPNGQYQEAEALANSLTNPYWKAEALVLVTWALARAGQHHQAETLHPGHSLARTIRRRVLPQVAGALARAGQHKQAEESPHSIIHPYWQAVGLALVARALAKAGQHEQATAAATQAETVARTIIDVDCQAVAQGLVAEALAGAGQHKQAETLAHSIIHPYWEAVGLALVARALAKAGQHEQATAAATQAEALAHFITNPDLQTRVLVRVAVGLVEVRSSQQAAAAATQAEAAAGLSVASSDQQDASPDAGRGRARRARQHQQAETLARSIIDPDWQAEALTQIAEALVKAGDTRSASRMAAITCTVGRWTIAARSVLLQGSSTTLRQSDACTGVTGK